MKTTRTALLIAAMMFAAGCAGKTHPAPLAKVVARHPRGVIAAVLPLPGRPHGVSIAASGAFCISQISSDFVTCGAVTATDAELGPSVHVGVTPASVSIDPAERFAYTANQRAGTVTIIDLDAPEVVGTIKLGDGGFNVLATASRVYITTAVGYLIVLDAETHKVVAGVRVGRGANGLAVDEAASVLYVSSIAAGTVTSIDLRTNTILRSYKVARGAQRITLSPDRRTLYVASEAAGAELLDVATGEVTSVAGVLPGAVGLALSPDGLRLYVTNPPRGLLQIVDVSTRRVRSTLNGLGTPRNVAFGANGATALVTNESGSVFVIR